MNNQSKNKTNVISIVWFRQDFRVSDNPALLAASQLGTVLPIYILDTLSPKSCRLGKASKVYLHYALSELNESLGGKLNLYVGNPEKIISKLVKMYNIQNVFWNRCYEPWLISADESLKNQLETSNIHYSIFNGSYLWEPEKILKEDGTYYKIFGAYKRKVLNLNPRKPYSAPKNLMLMQDCKNKIQVQDFELIPEHHWHEKMKIQYAIGETEAKKKLVAFIKHDLLDYKQRRDYPAEEHTSKLSAHLHFGEISPYQIWDAVCSKSSNIPTEDREHFLSELLWREFSCYLLYHFKELYKDNVIKKFDNFPWKNETTMLKAWQTGHTGYPMVDAGMRELWQTGYMHNRVRMIVASFLVKNLMIHWHYGRDWFWDCLLDADLANNSASWQWVAGCGVDSAPYFRIFNPTMQGKKFDPDGNYIKKYVPELIKLPSRYLFEPWEAPAHVLKAAGVVLGDTYPRPMIDLKKSRAAALMSYKMLKT